MTGRLIGRTLVVGRTIGAVGAGGMGEVHTAALDDTGPPARPGPALDAPASSAEGVRR